MASITIKKDRFLARIRRRGAPRITRTFGSMDEAVDWSVRIEAEVERRIRGGLSMTSAELDPQARYQLPEKKIQLTVNFQAQSGIYFLYRGCECVYIGKSTNIRDRIEEHRKNKSFDIYSWMPVQFEVMDMMETLLIATMKPSENTMKLNPSAPIPIEVR